MSDEIKGFDAEYWKEQERRDWEQRVAQMCAAMKPAMDVLNAQNEYRNAVRCVSYLMVAYLGRADSAESAARHAFEAYREVCGAVERNGGPK